MVAAVDHGDLGAAAVDDHDVLDGGGADIEGGVDVGLEHRGFTASIAGVGGDDQAGIGVVAAVDDRVGLNPPKMTECATPMRAHASMATGSSGIIGM